MILSSPLSSVSSLFSLWSTVSHKVVSDLTNYGDDMYPLSLLIKSLSPMASYFLSEISSILSLASLPPSFSSTLYCWCISSNYGLGVGGILPCLNGPSLAANIDMPMSNSEYQWLTSGSSFKANVLKKYINQWENIQSMKQHTLRNFANSEAILSSHSSLR